MKILKLTAENIKRLRAVEITPTGEIVTIAGKNGQGKTSVLDSMWWALAGTKHIQTQPIRKGQTKARVRLDLGELIVERRFTESGSTLSVETVEGARYPSPQTMLDALLGELSFDPLAFARMTPREQFDELRRIVKLEVDIDNLDRLNAGDYDRRTQTNREAKALLARAQGIQVAADLPEAPVEERELLDKLQEASDHNAMISRVSAQREATAKVARDRLEYATRATQEAKELMQKADDLIARAATWQAEAAATSKEIAEAPALPQPLDSAALRAELDRARQTNALLQVREQRRELERQAASFDAQSKELTDKIQAREQEKFLAISKAQTPVEGIGFGDGFVTFRGVPFDQASSAEQLLMSLSIAMAANPKLRVIRIQDGSLLDADSLAAIGKKAKEHDYQVWIETVSDDGKVGVVIEDGMVKIVHEQEKP